MRPLDKDILSIFNRYMEGDATEGEKMLVDEYYTFFDRVPPETGLSADEKENLRIHMYEHITRQISQIRGRWMHWVRYVAAACLAAGLLFLFYRHRKSEQAGQLALHQPHPIIPASPRASIVLSDGTRQDLVNAPLGTVPTREQPILQKVYNGLLQYSSEKGNAGMPQRVTMNTLETPRGGYYQVILADGSHIWLDAASSLRYDAAFAGSIRTVELTGQAYFEIAPYHGLPFRVRYKDQVLEVLGTHFNVDAYGDHGIQTTVLKGKVRVTPLGRGDARSVELEKGQQSIFINDALTTKKVDTNDIIAWKNNVFSFKNATVREILSEASRWYDVDVVYDTDIPDRRIDGRPSRNLPFVDFLRIISLTGVHCSLKGDTLHVSQ
jgi:transmembrane sensor